MAGSISLSLDQLLNELGTPLAGGRIYFYQAGTTTPQSAYQDSDLTLPLPNPVILDSVGAVPQLYFADGFIKFRVTNSAGVTVIAADNVLVVGPSTGSGGVSVDATTVFSTGDVKWRYGTGAHSGWVRFNGRTIGSASSGATERANADTEALYVHLYNADPNLAVAGGRGANAAADFAANKALTLPDCRNRTIAALGDMGNTDAGLLTASYFGASGITLGAVGGLQSHTLTQAQLPIVTPAGSISTPSITVTFNGGAIQHTPLAPPGTGGSSFNFLVLSGGSGSTALVASSSTPTFTGSSFGSGNPHNVTQPTILMTLYGKL